MVVARIAWGLVFFMLLGASLTHLLPGPHTHGPWGTLLGMMGMAMIWWANEKGMVDK